MKQQDWFCETLYPFWSQRFKIEKILFEQQTEHFHLVIFENPFFGRVMAIDGAIQTTEKDEFAYHEMLTHVPLFSHSNPKKILIIGGGDGGILREVLKHPVKEVTMVEIDVSVIEMAQQYFPGHSVGAFNDSRLNLVIGDGAAFVKTAKETYDVIIVDSTDPVGPGKVLFSQEFYQDCHRCLNTGGIFVSQNGVPFLQQEELKTSYHRLSQVFQDVSFYTTVVPTYAGGFMTLGWATNDETLRLISFETLSKRKNENNFITKYYNSQIHQASFALPNFIQEHLEK